MEREGRQPDLQRSRCSDVPLLHDHVGNAAEHEHGGDRPKQNDWMVRSFSCPCREGNSPMLG
jgi:hypothetical protein